MSGMKTILSQRESTHGDYATQAQLTQSLKRQFQSMLRYSTLDPEMREALEMICMKMARIVCGDSTFLDHWIDIIGYAELVKGVIMSRSEPMVALKYQEKLARNIEEEKAQRIAGNYVLRNS